RLATTGQLAQTVVGELDAREGRDPLGGGDEERVHRKVDARERRDVVVEEGQVGRRGGDPRAPVDELVDPGRTVVVRPDRGDAGDPQIGGVRGQPAGVLQAAVA